MKKYSLIIFFSFLICSSVFARSTGCKEGNCENGFGKWVYTDKTTYEGEWVNTKKQGQGIETWPMVISIKVNLKIVNGADREL